MLAKLLRKPLLSIARNEDYSGDRGIICKHAGALGCEGILSKRLDSTYPRGSHRHLAKGQEPGGACGQTWPRRMGTDCPEADIIARLRIGPTDCALRLS
jgi:hypothetical protein